MSRMLAMLATPLMPLMPLTHDAVPGPEGSHDPHGSHEMVRLCAGPDPSQGAQLDWKRTYRLMPEEKGLSCAQHGCRDGKKASQTDGVAKGNSSCDGHEQEQKQGHLDEHERVDEDEMGHDGKHSVHKG